MGNGRFGMTFTDAVMAGKASLDEIDTWIEEWHTGEIDGALHQHLGFTWNQYAQWVESPAALETLIAEVRQAKRRS